MGYRQTHADGGLGGISGVVSSLPAGYELGEERREDGKDYILAYNAGGEQAGPGYFLTPIKTGAGPYSMTVTTTSKTHDHLGACLVQHATATTDTYFWGLVKGVAAGVVADNISVATGSAFYIASDGQVSLMPQSVATGIEIVGRNMGSGATKTVTTGVQSGDPYIDLL